MTFAPPRSVPRLTRFRTRSHEALGKTTCTRKSTILPNDTAIIPQSGFALQGGQVSPVWGKSMPNHQKPLILLGHFDFNPAKHPSEKNFFSPISTPAVRGLTHPRAPFRAISPFSARVVLALRATRPLSMPWLLRQLVRSPTARLRRKLGERPTHAVRHRKANPTRCLSSPSAAKSDGDDSQTNALRCALSLQDQRRHVKILVADPQGHVRGFHQVPKARATSARPDASTA